MKFLNTLKETFISSLPLAVVIIVVCIFIAPMENPSDYLKLAVGYVAVVLGQTIFLNGLDYSILPIGKLVGGSLGKIKKVSIIIGIGFLFGLLATVAEPALIVLARQTNMIMGVINANVFIWVSSVGIGLFVAFALYRILRNFNIKIVFLVLYGIIFAMIFFVPEEFIALAFDGSGATTGDISVPFILALGLGASATMSKTKTNEDTFGIIGIASAGPIIALFIYGIIMKLVYGGTLPPSGIYNPGETGSLGEIILSNLGGVALTLVPIIVVFLPFQFLLIKLNKKELSSIMLGMLAVFAGLLIFLTGIDYGFAFAGKYIGEVFLNPVKPEWFKWMLLIVAFVLGVAITFTEPAVTVLGEQLETVTNGHIKKSTIRITLAIGIGFASLLAMVKILTQINILWFLTPLYVIALIMMKFSNKLFVGLAFDSGGVTGGALTSAFLTPLTLGAAQAVALTSGEGAQSVLINGFGIIAFVSVTPLIAVQALGIIYNIQLKKQQKNIETAGLAELSELASLAHDTIDAPFVELESIDEIAEPTDGEEVKNDE